jgi:hypothetical protein
MSFEIQLEDFEQGFHELFKQAFVINCNLDEESVTSQESKILQNLDTTEILENFKDLVIDLLKFKKDYISSDKAELASRNEQFEKMLQKLESQVRNHIRIEHQLKLHIENSQQRILELEKLDNDNKLHIKLLEEKSGGKNFIKLSELEKIKKEMDEKIKNLVEAIDKKDKAFNKIDHENSKLKNLLEEKTRECEVMRKEIIKIRKLASPSRKELSTIGNLETLNKKEFHSASSTDNLRRTLELNKIRNMFKQKSPTTNKGIMKTERKKSLDYEIFKQAASPYTKREYSHASKREENKSSKSSQIKTHIRSSSDQKVLSSIKSLLN